jgi:transcription antitermination protein NusB
MQTIYAMHKNGSEDIVKNEKYLLYSIEAIQDLYLTMISTLLEIAKKESNFLEKSSKKHTATKLEKNPNRKFVNNAVLNILENSNSLSQAIEKSKINHWYLNEEYINLLLKEIKESSFYTAYMNQTSQSFKEDKQLIVDIFSQIIVTNEKIYDYIEDDKLSWVDDIPVVNTLIVKQLNALKSEKSDFTVPSVYKDSDDTDFVKEIFRKTVLNETELAQYFIDKTPNWDMERIAEIDTIILKMAIAEFTKFPSIPVKVTLNEYLELAKEYSTPKSSVFINGILDRVVKELENDNKLNKAGRGLL